MWMGRLFWWTEEDEKQKLERLYMRRMEKALRLEDYRSAALQLDALQHRDRWKEDPRSEWYDHEMIGRRLIQLQRVSESSTEAEKLFALRSGCWRNLGGIGSERLVRACHWGTKRLIERYVDLTVTMIEDLTRESGDEESTDQIDQIVPMQVKHDFLLEMLQAVGRTALILHGGASFGASHLGVCKALNDQQMLPRILCGSYIGALVAALVCVQPPEMLGDVLAGRGLDLADITQGSSTSSPSGPSSSFQRRLIRFLKYGHIFDVHILESWSRQAFGDLTFRESLALSSFEESTDSQQNHFIAARGKSPPAINENTVFIDSIYSISIRCLLGKHSDDK